MEQKHPKLDKDDECVCGDGNRAVAKHQRRGLTCATSGEQHGGINATRRSAGRDSDDLFKDI